MPIVASNAIKDITLVGEGASDAASLARYLEENVLESGSVVATSYDESTTSTATVCETTTLFVRIRQEVKIDHRRSIISEICRIVRVKRLELISQIEVLNKTIKGAENRQSVRRPLFLHILLDSCTIKGVAILIRHNNLISIKVVHAQLNSDPLIVGQINQL